MSSVISLFEAAWISFHIKCRSLHSLRIVSRQDPFAGGYIASLLSAQRTNSRNSIPGVTIMAEIAGEKLTPLENEAAASIDGGANSQCPVINNVK